MTPGASDVSETNSCPPTRVALPGETAQACLLQRLDRHERIVPAQDDERLTGGNAIDDQLEDRALILRGGQPWEQQEREQAERRESPRAQRGHAPFGV